MSGRLAGVLLTSWLCVACDAPPPTVPTFGNGPTRVVAVEIPAPGPATSAGTAADEPLAEIAPPMPAVATASSDVDIQGERREALRRILATPRHRPSALAGPPRPSRIPVGNYKCRVSKEYKLKACRVYKSPAGHTMLEVSDANLIGATGVLWDEGRSVRFEGWHTSERPFGCFACQERCFITPGSCHCVPHPDEAIEACLGQAVHITMNGGRTMSGEIRFKSYWNDYADVGGERQLVGFHSKDEQLQFVLIVAR